MSMAPQLNAIRAWVESGAGVSAVWAHDGGPRPAYPYAMLRILDDQVQGASERYAHNPAAPQGSDMELSVRQDGLLTVGCQVFAKPSASHDASARSLLAKARDALHQPSTKLALREAGAALEGIAMPIQDLSAEVNGEMLLRAAMDVTFNTVRTLTPADPASYIQTTQGVVTIHDKVDGEDALLTIDTGA